MNNSNKDNGFTLIEVMVGMIIFILALQGLAVFGFNTAKAHVSSERLTAATMLARNTIEDIKGMRYDQIASMDSTNEYGTISGYGEFKVNTKITTQNNPDFKTVIVTVYWTSDKHSFQLTTAIADH
ncbi:MAG: type II secretion system protein [Chitinispirillia bacterium]|jgi:Tfp pilus assembly protein PilV